MHHAHFGVVQAFGESEQQGKLINQLPVALGKNFLIEAVLEIILRDAIMPACDGAGNDLLLMREAEKLRILNHIGAVACMGIKVNRNANIVQEGCRFQQTTIIAADLMQLLPTIEHGQCQLRDMACMRRIRFKKIECVLGAALKNILRDERNII